MARGRSRAMKAMIAGKYFTSCRMAAVVASGQRPPGMSLPSKVLEALADSGSNKSFRNTGVAERRQDGSLSSAFTLGPMAAKRTRVAPSSAAEGREIPIPTAASCALTAGARRRVRAKH